KSEETIHHMPSAGRRDAFVDEPVLAVPAAPGIEADAPVGPNQATDTVGAPAGMHVQQHVEMPVAQLLPQRFQTGAAGLLVHDDKLDARQVADQFGLAAIDDPTETSLRPVPLQRMHDRHDVGTIAQRRQAQQADAVWRRGHHESGWPAFRNRRYVGLSVSSAYS